MRISRRQFSKESGLAMLALGLLPLHLMAETHTVKKGDSLSRIARRYDTTTKALKNANRLSGDLIRVGQRLKIPDTSYTDSTQSPSPTVYTVKKGDTLGRIALIQGCTVTELKRANNLSNDLIRVGQQLKVPTNHSTNTDFLKKVRAETSRIHVRRENWQRIVVHHSAIKYGNATVYDKTHRQRGMQNGLAYHFLIGNGIDSGDGEIEIGPRWTKQLLGGHVKSYQINLTAIGICLIGNFEESHPTRRQLAAFTQLMDWLRGEILPNAKQFAGHRELRGEQTICPGKNFPLEAMHRRYG